MKFFNKLTKFIFIFLAVFGLAFSNLPYEALTEALKSYNSSRNVVDKIWMTSNDSNVVDKFIPFETVIRNLKIKDALAVSNGDGKIFYSISANTTPRTRDYISSTNSFNTAASTVVGATALQAVTKASPTKDEMIAGYVNSAGTLQVMCWNGTSWTNEWSVATGGTGTTRRFDIAYETNSGDVIVAYSRNAAATNAVDYRTKLGSTGCGTANWAAAASVPTTTALTTGTVHWVKMAHDRRSAQNLIAIIWADSNADLGASIWSGSAFGNFPTTAQMEQSLEVVTAAQDVEDFDVEYESLTGDVMVVWANSAGANGTNGAYYNVCTGGTSTCTWGTRTAMPTVIDDATHLDIAGDPNSDKILYGAIGNAGSDMSRGVWSGSAWTNTANADITSTAPTAGTKFIAVGWLNNGATNRGVLVYYDSAATNVGWNTVSGTTWTAQTDWTPTPVFGAQRNYDIRMDPINKDRLIFTVNDANSDIFSKRLIMDAAGAFTWTNADGGAAIEANTGSATYKSFNFEYNRYIPIISTLVTGSDPGAGIIIAPGAGAQDVDLFTLQTNSGTESVTSVTVNLSTSNGVGTLAITDNANAVLGSIGGGTGSGIVTGSNAISVSGMSAVSASATTFKVRVTPLSHANMLAPDGADYSITAPVTSWAGSGGYTHTGSDTNPNALTIDNNSPAGTTGAGATSGESTQSTVSWTNPGDTDFQQVYIYCKTSSMISGEAPAEGTDPAVDATACDGTARMKYKGTVSGQIITGLTNGTLYNFRIYARDTNGNFTVYSATQEVSATPSAPAPNATSYTDDTEVGLNNLGGRTGQTITITGTNFDSATSPNRANCAGGASTGCVQVGAYTIPDGNFTVWNSTTITFSIPVAITSYGAIITVTSASVADATPLNFKVYPNITSISPGGAGEAKEGDTITITGTRFGLTQGTNKVLIDGVAAAISGWSDTSIDAVVPSAINDSNNSVTVRAYQGTEGDNIIYDDSASFVILPQITGTVDVPTAEPDAAREYSASDSDGIFTVNGNHFGAAGTVTILGGASTQQTTTTCSGSAYQATCVGLRVPDVAGYTGNIILTRTADTKTNTYAGFRVLPRIISTTPVNLKGGRGDTIAITGDHLCQSGTCPSAFSATNSVNFNGGSVTSGASVWTDTSIPSIVIPGTAIDGNLNITSNTSYTSNNLTYNIKFAPTTPTNSTPTNGATGESKNPTLIASNFDDGTDGDTHTDSQWQITRVSSDYTAGNKVWEDTLATAQVTIVVNSTNGTFTNTTLSTELNCGTTYYWHIRYKDNAGVTSQEWSAYSSEFSFTTASCGPDATSVTNNDEPAITDGGRIGHANIVISGSGFGTVNAGSRATCAGGAGTGCVKIGGTSGQTIADARVTAWANTSITIQLSLTDLTTTYGGATISGLIVYAAGASDSNGLTFYVYPDITSLTTPLGTNDGAREYAAADGDGIITITGNKFGTGPTGGQTVIVGGTVATYVADGTCDAVDGWTETCIKVQVPATISDSTDSGYVIVTQGTGSNNKTSNSTDAQSAINIWPRVTGFTGSQSEGGYQSETFTLSGNHFGASAGSISVNGQTQDGTPTWGAVSIAGVGIPNTGTDSGSITLTKSDTKTSNTFSTFFIYPQITSFTASQGDGDVQTANITITGNHFGTGGGNAQILINNVAPSATTPTWGAGSITNVDIPNAGTDSGVIVITNPATTKSSNNSTSFYIYPQISSLTVPTATPDAAREYMASDTDGIITVNGNHFGVAGSVTVLGSAGTQQTTGTCSGSAYQTTCTGIQIPTAISDSSYTGNVILTRTADTKTNTYSSFRVLPRIISLNPNTGITNDPIIIIGDHLCQTGTCPLAGSRSTASDNVTFFSGVQVTDGNVTVWGHGDSSTSGVNVNVPSSAATGNVAVTSNSYISNGINFTKASSAPADPTNLYQFETNTDLDEPPASYDPLTETNPAGKVVVGGGINQTNVWMRATASAGVNSTLCIEVEAKTVATAFDGIGTVLATSAPGCQSFTVGTPVKLFVNVTTGLTDGNNYKWRARIKNNGTSEYGNWVNASVDGSSKSFYIDTSAPSSLSSTCPPSTYTASTADIAWTPSDNISTTFTKQVQYDDNSDFSSSICTPGATCGTPTSGLGANPQTEQLTGLAPSTVYYYRARSKDAAGNEKIEGYGLSGNTICTFTTSQAQMRTAEYIITGEAAAISAAVSRAFQVYVTEQGSNIQNAFIEVSGIAGTGGGASLTFGLKVVGSADPGYTNYDVAVSNTVSTPFTILHKVDPTASGLYIAPTQATNNNLWMNPSVGPSVYIASAKIIVTYYYTPQ